jgi:Kef-type K+ transport system membrane component KefB
MVEVSFLIIFLILIFLMVLIPHLLKKFYIPSIIAILILGILIGPNSFDLVDKLNYLLGSSYPSDQIYFVIEIIGLLGLVFLMSLAGLDTNLNLIRSEKKTIFRLSFIIFCIPAITGFFVYRYFRPEDIIGQVFYASLFASYSVAIIFPTIKELNIVKTRFGVSILSSTIIIDICSLILLASCLQLVRAGTVSSLSETISIFDHFNFSFLGIFYYPLFFGLIILFFILSIWLVPKIANHIFRNVDFADTKQFIFYLITVLTIVLIGEFIGIHLIVGAFIAGLALSNVDQFKLHHASLSKKLDFSAYGFFIPFLFLSVGMKFDLSLLFLASENILIIIYTFIGLVISKIFAGWVAMRLSGFSNIKGFLGGLMTVPQLDATIAAAVVGLNMGILQGNFYNAIIILSIITAIPIPIIIKYILTKTKIEFEPCVNDEFDKTSVK